MMTILPRHQASLLLLALSLSLSAIPCAHAQDAPSSQNPPQKPTAAPTDEPGPQTDSGDIVLKKKKEADEPPAPVAPEAPKVKNPNNETYSLRIDVPIVNIDASVILDKTHQFVAAFRNASLIGGHIHRRELLQAPRGRKSIDRGRSVPGRESPQYCAGKDHGYLHGTTPPLPLKEWHFGLSSKDMAHGHCTP